MPDNTNYPVAPMPTRNRLQTLQAVRDHSGGGFDIDAWHVMDQRDNALIADEILSGSGSSKFVYQFSVSGTQVTGISVIGARHLAAFYGGIKHRMIASVQKIGALHTFTSYPQPGMPMEVRCAVVHELEDQDDYYSAIVELTDVKTGNSVQVEKRESRQESRRDGSKFDRPHYQIIAQSKAFRNGVLSLIPQDVQLKFKLQMLELGKDEVITASVLQQKRAGVLQFAAKNSMAVDRHAIEKLTLPQISGLSEAARGGLDGFRSAAWSLGVMAGAAPLTVEGPGVSPETGGESGKSAAPRQEVPKTAKPAAPAAGPPREAPPPPAFEHYLVDEVGEVVNDVYTDPGLLAEGFLRLHELATDRQTLGENNTEALAAAMRYPNAAAVLAQLPEPGNTALEGKPKPEVGPIPLVRGGRGPDVPGYVKAATAAIATLAADEIDSWVRVNEPTFRAFPTPRKLEISKALAGRRQALGVPPPASQAAPGLPLGDEDGPDDEAWSYEVGEEISRCTSEDELHQLVARERVRADQAKARNPGAWKRVSERADAKMAVLKRDAGKASS